MQLIWTEIAIKSLNDIFYFYDKFAGKKVAKSMVTNIINCSKTLKKHPFSGIEEPALAELNQGHRFLICGYYKVFYIIEGKKIFITDVFDTRQNPDNTFKKLSS
jgi:plasmid stabilization system protein ParE